MPKTSALYWICQVAGWSAYLAYVLVGYLIYAKAHQPGDIVSIVLFCTIVPILMTHGLRHWMHLLFAHRAAISERWLRRSLWDRGLRIAGHRLMRQEILAVS